MSPAALAPKWEAPAAERIALQPGSIHLWAAETARLQSAEPLLSAAERASLARQRAPASRAMALRRPPGARMLLRPYSWLPHRPLRLRA